MSGVSQEQDPTHSHGIYTFRNDRCLVCLGGAPMLIVSLQNDGTGDEITGSYNVVVRINRRLIWSGRVENHLRTSGWPGLLHRLATQEGYNCTGG